MRTLFIITPLARAHLERRRILPVLGFLLLWPPWVWTQPAGDTEEWYSRLSANFTVHYTGRDSSLVPVLVSAAARALLDVGTFFSHPFASRFDIFLFPDRPSLDRQWKSAWNDSTFRSECWMVAGGVADRLDLLSPRVWKTQACEHDPADSLGFLRLLTHELVHVFHGQHNPKPTFDGLDSLAWFIEGVATYASGQLDDRRLAETRSLVREGKAPLTLGTFWTGKARYGIAGSMALYIDTTYGRQALYRLLTFTDQRSMLAILERTEKSLLDSWKTFILAGSQ
jgi:hypothetical protein